MAKQSEDTVTAELPVVPVKKRGRPATGNALTPAERKRRQRERIDSMVWSIPENGGRAPSEMPLTALLEGLAQAVSAGAAGLARALADELVARSVANQKYDSHGVPIGGLPDKMSGSCPSASGAGSGTGSGTGPSTAFDFPV